MAKKRNAAIVLGILALSLMVVGVATPDLAFFLKTSYDSMFSIGKSVGSALASALGMPILELVGIVLFIA